MKKFSKPNFYSIKSQLTVWIALQILIPVFFISIFSTALSVRFSNRQAVNYARDLLAVIRKEFESKRDEIFKVSQELLYDENIFDSMLMLDPELLNESRLRSTLFSVCLSHPEIDAVGLEVDGRYIKSEKHRGHLFNYDSIIYRDLLAQIESSGGEALWYVKSHDDSAPGGGSEPSSAAKIPLSVCSCSSEIPGPSSVTSISSAPSFIRVSRTRVQLFFVLDMLCLNEFSIIG